MVILIHLLQLKQSCRPDLLCGIADFLFNRLVYLLRSIPRLRRKPRRCDCDALIAYLDLDLLRGEAHIQRVELSINADEPVSGDLPLFEPNAGDSRQLYWTQMSLFDQESQFWSVELAREGGQFSCIRECPAPGLDPNGNVLYGGKLLVR